jgi:hypothetical protein
MRERGLFAVMVLLACGDGRGPDTGLFGSGEGSVSADDSGDPSGDPDGTSAASGSGSASVSASADDAADSGGDGPKFDTPDGATMEGGDDQEGCEKIDFLFAIDNSCSMGAHQQRLIQAFPSFIDTIFSTVQAQDYQIMVVDSDANQDQYSGCAPSGCPGLIDWCGNYCDVQDLMTPCDYELGAGVIQPYNMGASNAVCGVPGNKRYLTSDTDQAQIESLFPCMAQVGTFGSGAEMPMSALSAAVTDQANACNAGFVRDDAVLVVTVISDDYPVPSTADDASTVGAPMQWYDDVVAAKNGHPEHVVMLGVINTEDASCVSGAGDPIVHPTERFVELVQMFGDKGIMGNICNEDYDAFFEQAVALIDTTCDEFEPEG